MKWKATHELRETLADGRRRRTRLLLCDDGSAYTRHEWNHDLAPGWALVEDEWLFQGGVMARDAVMSWAVAI